MPYKKSTEKDPRYIAAKMIYRDACKQYRRTSVFDANNAKGRAFQRVNDASMMLERVRRELEGVDRGGFGETGRY